MITRRFFPERARQLCPECNHALATTPVTRIVGTVRVREHVCPVKGCGCRWKTHETITEPVTVTTTGQNEAPPAKPVVRQRKNARRR